MHIFFPRVSRRGAAPARCFTRGYSPSPRWGGIGNARLVSTGCAPLGCGRAAPHPRLHSVARLGRGGASCLLESGHAIRARYNAKAQNPVLLTRFLGCGRRPRWVATLRPRPQALFRLRLRRAGASRGCRSERRCTCLLGSGHATRPLRYEAVGLPRTRGLKRLSLAPGSTLSGSGAFGGAWNRGRRCARPRLLSISLSGWQNCRVVRRSLTVAALPLIISRRFFRIFAAPSHPDHR
jgi:hypothetical protein